MLVYRGSQIAPFLGKNYNLNSIGLANIPYGSKSPPEFLVRTTERRYTEIPDPMDL